MKSYLITILLFFSCGIQNISAGASDVYYNRESLELTDADLLNETFPSDTTHLSLNGNLFTTVPSGVFVNLTHLKVLHLHGNAITTVTDYAFLQVGATLESMNLRKNDIRVIKTHMFSGRVITTHMLSVLTCESH